MTTMPDVRGHASEEGYEDEEEDDEEEEMQPKSQRRARHHRPARDSRAPLRVDRDHDDGDSSDMEINTPEEKESKWKHLVDRLKDMGFTHEKKNIAALERYNGDINKAVHLLIQSEGSKSPPKDQKKQKPNRSSNSSSSSGHVSGQRGSASKANKIQMQWGKSTSSSKKRAASASSRRDSSPSSNSHLSSSLPSFPLVLTENSAAAPAIQRMESLVTFTDHSLDLARSLSRHIHAHTLTHIRTHGAQSPLLKKRSGKRYENTHTIHTI
mmetsp:Transcript_6596/g.16073  ORF Transcript_6596/g.16073 Transcript_6596/m.16073 type:complete len:268 (-) Transcript_6596:192-995(-)